MLAGTAGALGGAMLRPGQAQAQSNAGPAAAAPGSSPPGSRYGDPAWWAQRKEEILEPALEIVDPHHHLWERNEHRYLIDELLADTKSGHNVTRSVFVECGSMYRADGPAEMKPVGEIEFVNGTAAMSASGRYGTSRLCAGIVGHRSAPRRRRRPRARGTDCGRRRALSRHPPFGGLGPQRELLARPHQLAEGPDGGRHLARRVCPAGAAEADLRSLALPPATAGAGRSGARLPQTTIILNHVGGPLGIGPYADKKPETFAQWKTGIAELGKCQNVVVKLGGLGMLFGMFDFHKRETPPGSEELAQAYKPYLETCVAAFGPDRGMFESNFPPDGVTSSYAVLWNAFKRLAAGYSADEKTKLFSGTAKRVYSLA